MGEVAKFIDDVIVGTDEEEGHDEVVEEVVRRLAENDLYVKGVLEWLTLEGVKDIQKFLKLASYYQWFIKDFAIIARPLHDPVKKNQKWDCTERQEKAFRELKERFTKELVLAVLDLDKKMRMEVNVSDYVTGGVLSIECEDKRWRPVAFLSKSLN